MSDSQDGALQRVERMIALQLVLGRKQVDQVAILHRAGMSPREIADVLGTSRNAVSVTLSQLRKGGEVRLPT